MNQSIIYKDPHKFDGDPHEVAQQTFAQAHQLVGLFDRAIADCEWAARSAWMTAEDARTGEMPLASDWDETPSKRVFDAAADRLSFIAERLRVLDKAASFNPHGPLGKHGE